MPNVEPITSFDEYVEAGPAFQWDSEIWPFKPYVGLRPFEKREWPIFCGRERIVEEILEVLGRSHFAFVIGASGCGKSSLVRAGVLATAEGLHGMVGVRWRTVTMRPGVKPLWSLAEEILKVGRKQGEKIDPEKVAELSIIIQHSEKGLEVIPEFVDLKPNENFLLLVDQFEELFRFETNADEYERQAFVALLVRVQRERPPGLYVLATMRAEFYGECTIYSGLTDVVNRTTYLVPPMTLEGMREAIGRPVSLKGGVVEDRLADQLLTDVERRTDDLPILQHTLSWLWSDAEIIRRPAARGPLNNSPAPALTFERYQEHKRGDESLISRHCNEIYDRLNADQQKIAEVMFRRMVSVVDDKGNRLRRQTCLSSIAEISGASLSDVDEVAIHFAAEGASFVDIRRSVKGEDAGIDITHESLIRQWGRLSDWQRAEKRSYETYKDLSRAAEKRREDGGELWTGNNLRGAICWREQEKPSARWARRYEGDFVAAMGFLSESEKRERASEEARKAEEALKQEERFRQAAQAKCLSGDNLIDMNRL